MKRDDLLDLNDVLQHPGRKLAVDIETEFNSEVSFELSKPLTGFLEAVSTGNLLLLKGEFNTGLIVGCARCGEPIEVPIKFDVDEQFNVEGVPSSYGNTDFARVVTEEPYPLFEGNVLMVENLLNQTLLLEIPMQALCQYGWDMECPIAKKRGADMRQQTNLLPLADLDRFRKSEESEG